MEDSEVPTPEEVPSPAPVQAPRGFSVPAPVAAGLLCLGLGLGITLGVQLARKAARAEAERAVPKVIVHECEECAKHKAANAAAVLPPDPTSAGSAPAPAVVGDLPATNGAGAADPTATFSPVAAAVSEG